MRTLLAFLVGFGLGVAALYIYQQQNGRPPSAAADSNLATSARDAAARAATKTREVTASLSEALGEKIRSWHLSGDEIKSELAKTGQVVRENSARAGEKVSDIRIVAVIKAKFVLDRDLSANAIEVQSQSGDVTLTGTVDSEHLVGKAIAHALDTEGVHHVVAKLVVRPPAR